MRSLISHLVLSVDMYISSAIGTINNFQIEGQQANGLVGSLAFARFIEQTLAELAIAERRIAKIDRFTYEVRGANNGKA